MMHDEIYYIDKIMTAILWVAVKVSFEPVTGTCELVEADLLFLIYKVLKESRHKGKYCGLFITLVNLLGISEPSGQVYTLNCVHNGATN